MRRSFLAVCALVAVACSPQTLPSAKTPQDPPLQDHVAEQLGIRPGERIEASLHHRGAELAKLNILFGSACSHRGRRLLPVQARIENSGWGTWLAARRIDHASWIDLGTERPVWTEEDIETPKRRANTALAFQPTGYRYVYAKKSKIAKKQRQRQYTSRRRREAPPGAQLQDVLTAVAAIRKASHSKRAYGKLHLVMGRSLWRVDYRVHGREQLQLAGSSRDAIRVDGIARRLHRPRGRSQRWRPSKRKTTIALWLSNDVGRRPLRARIRHRKRHFDLQLTAHKPGEPSGVTPCGPGAELPPRLSARNRFGPLAANKRRPESR